MPWRAMTSAVVHSTYSSRGARAQGEHGRDQLLGARAHQGVELRVAAPLQHQVVRAPAQGPRSAIIRAANQPVRQKGGTMCSAAVEALSLQRAASARARGHHGRVRDAARAAAMRPASSAASAGSSPARLRASPGSAARS